MPHTCLEKSSLNRLAQRATQRFEQRFGRAPRVVAAAPGRVNLIGEHTDYNGGYVLPMTIDRHVVIAGDTPPVGEPGHRVRCHSGAFDDTAMFSVTADLRPGEPRWSNMVRGIVAGMLKAGGDVSGFDCEIEADIPLGSGLSSSAALEVAVATLMEGLFGRPLDPTQKARLCQQAEHEFAGVPCGIMDQLSSVMGSPTDALLIDCDSEQVRFVPLSDDISILVMNCKISHSLAESPYADRRSACFRAAESMGVRSLRHASRHRLEAFRDRLSQPDYRRARHVITENERTLAAADAISRRDWIAAGALMFESHASMRDDFEISCPELDMLVDAARRIGRTGGVFGSRLTGGGFGGSTVTLVQADSACLVAEKLADEYQERNGSKPDWFIPRPTAGARLLSTDGEGAIASRKN